MRTGIENRSTEWGFINHFMMRINKSNLFIKVSAVRDLKSMINLQTIKQMRKKMRLHFNEESILMLNQKLLLITILSLVKIVTELSSLRNSSFIKRFANQENLLDEH